MVDLEQISLETSRSLKEVFECLERTAHGIVLVTRDSGELECTITDGDLRRAVLRGESLDLTIAEWLPRRAAAGDRLRPVTLPFGATHGEILALMQEHSLRHIPLVDEAGRVVNLAELEDLVHHDDDEPFPPALVMAGGFGTRLRPLTEDTPKPMLPVGDRPILEHIVSDLKAAGVSRLSITTHYKSEAIVDHFGDGNGFGVTIDYIKEPQPLGTAGALALLREPPNEPMLVINGDILTRVDFRAMFRFHREHRAAMTVGIRKYDIEVPYGVIETDGLFLRGLVEKPRHSFFINAGIYILEPRAHSKIPLRSPFNMTDLIELLTSTGESVVTFPILEEWLDIGRPEDYARAVSSKADAAKTEGTGEEARSDEVSERTSP